MSQGGIHRPALLLLEERQSGPRSTGELVEFGDLSEGSTGNGSRSSDALVHGSEFLGLFGFGSFRLGGGLGLTTVQLDRSSTGVTGGSARGSQERIRFRSLWDYRDPRIDSRVSVATVTTSKSATSSGGISGQALASVSADHWDIQGGSTRCSSRSKATKRSTHCSCAPNQYRGWFPSSQAVRRWHSS